MIDVIRNTIGTVAALAAALLLTGGAQEVFRRLLPGVSDSTHLVAIAGVEQDTLGIWTSPSGAKVAWFKDPDGNNLSLTQFG